MGTDNGWDDVATWLRQRLDELGWEQTDVADRAQVSIRLVTDLVNSNRTNFRASKIDAIEWAIGAKPGTFQAIREGKAPPPPGQPPPGSQASVRDVDAKVSQLLEVAAGIVQVQREAADTQQRLADSQQEIAEMLREMRQTLP